MTDLKKVVIAGASGMIGSLILENCLDHHLVSEVISLVRRKSEKNHAKLTEVLMEDFTKYDAIEDVLVEVDIAFFCIGAYTGAVPDTEFKKITVDYAVEFAKLLRKTSPNATFCLLSGAGADRTEKSKMAFAKYKGMAENQIARLGFESCHFFRPGYIYPVEKRREPNISYRLMRTLYPLIKIFGKNMSIKSTQLSEAMVKVGLEGHKQEVLENKDILNILS